ncbi:serine hydrolase [Halorubrum sp. 48-1-W]|uniref:serine hydrolase domain-containing protein n=1 Tax=Halorubrum sp. 48-1-W TaxID=2249761 RepID=UPI000DCC06BF|nr:serine hydrolase [Halorubrum sp. 48-1-W]RAW44508.1 serine hydrolase [Halorubrum sp. 48-1-W]
MYVPDRTEWERRDPETVGLDPEAVESAVSYHQRHGTPHERINYDFANYETWDEAEGADGRRIGPHPARRGGPAGMVLKDGYLVAEWGDTRRVDQAFSVAKSFLSVVAGVAWDRGRIDDVDDHLREYVDDGGFESERNREIRWRHLLQQTSEWEGTLFGKPDAVDRNRAVGKDAAALDKSETRALREPGTFWEYNDVRINRLALSLLRTLGRPLPRVLAENVMEPVGATDTWEWHGYHNSMVSVDGMAMRSVSGGGHWGGGLWISARDLARVGLLYLNGGVWDGTRAVSEAWVDASTEPCDLNENYGYLWWLNTNRALWPSAPESAYAALGHGQNTVWVDPEHDVVVVLRWLDYDEDDGTTAQSEQDAFYAKLLAGLD